MDADASIDDEVYVYNQEKFPGWRFKLTFSPVGILVGFEVLAPGMEVPGSLAEAVKELRERPRHRHRPGAPAVTTRMLRSLPLGEMETVAKRDFVEKTKRWEPEGPRWAGVFADSPRPGRRGRDDRAYAEIAALYVDEVLNGASGAVKRLAARLHYSPSQIRSVLYAARRRGLLTESPNGKAGGELTEKARRLIHGTR